jgi:hypothetical protein
MTKALVLLAVSQVSSGCNLTQPQAATVPAKPAPVKPFVGPDQLYCSDFGIQKSPNSPIFGDLRPFYRVQGRIQNNSQYTVTGMRLVVKVWTVGGMKDSAVLNLKTDILPGEAQTFKQEIQLSPPPGKWNWSYFFQSVEAEDSVTHAVDGFAAWKASPKEKK